MFRDRGGRQPRRGGRPANVAAIPFPPGFRGYDTPPGPAPRRAASSGGVLIGLLGLIFLFHTIAQVIAIWLPVWAGYLITTALLFVVAGVLGLVGYKTVTKAKPVPKKAIRR